MFLIGLVHTKNQPINPFQKSINLSNLLMTEKNYSKMARHNVIEIQSMPEIQCEAVRGTNPVQGELSTNRPADYTLYKLVHQNKNCYIEEYRDV